MQFHENPISLAALPHLKSELYGYRMKRIFPFFVREELHEGIESSVKMFVSRNTLSLMQILPGPSLSAHIAAQINKYPIFTTPYTPFWGCRRA